MKTYFKILRFKKQVSIFLFLVTGIYVSHADQIKTFNPERFNYTPILFANDIPVNFYTTFPTMGLNSYFIQYKVQETNSLENQLAEVKVSEINLEVIEKPLQLPQHSGISYYLNDEINVNTDFEIIKIHFK